MSSVRSVLTGRWPVWLLLLCTAGPARALDVAVPFVEADVLWSLGYTGSGVEIGVLDIFLADSTHPAISGNFIDSVKFVNGGAWTSFHATAVTGTAVSQDPTYTGVAPGAGWWTGQTTKRSTMTRIRTQTVAAETFGQGLGSLDGNAVEVITLSIGLGGSGSGSDQWSLALDHIVDTNGRTITVAAGNEGEAGPGSISGLPTGAFNAIIVGATGGTGSVDSEDYTQVAAYSSRGPTADGRAKPDIVAPGSLIHVPTLGVGWTDATGTSLATPMVAGGAALLIDMGRELGHSTDPRVIKSVLLNSADKLAGWTHTTTQPLDYSQGAGQMNLQKAYHQYLLGEQDPGSVLTVGWDRDQATWDAERLYSLDAKVAAGKIISATLSWDRIVTTNTEDIQTAVYTLDHMDNLELYLYEADDLTTPIATSVSTVDNVEHIYYTTSQSGHYVLGVGMAGASSGDSELYGLSWHVLHDPASILLAGDADVDGDVDFDDFLDMQVGWTGPGANDPNVSWADGDYDGDLDVDFDDFVALRLNWTGALGAPEPATLSLLALGGIALLRRRRKA